MTPTSAVDPSYRRRTVLLASATVLAATAGCLGDPDEAAAADPSPSSDSESDGDGTEDASEPDSAPEDDASADPGGDAGACEDITGTMVLYDPGERDFPFLFVYPDTFEEYNAEINESPSNLGAQFGHSATASGTYPVNIAIYQHKAPTTDDEALTNWVTMFDMSDRIDWSFDYEGEEISVYQSDISDDRSRQWRFLLPAADVDGAYGVFVQFQDVRSEDSCLETITGVAQALIESLEANPDYVPPA